MGIEEAFVYLRYKLKFNKLKSMFNKTPEQQQAIRNTIKLKMTLRQFVQQYQPPHQAPSFVKS